MGNSPAFLLPSRKTLQILHMGVVLMADRLEVTFLEVTLKLPCWPGVLSALL